MDDKITAKAMRVIELRNICKNAENELKQYKKDLSEAESTLIDILDSAGLESITTCGFKFTPTAKLYVNTPAENMDMVCDVLHSQGLGDIVQRRVNPQTMTGTVNNMIKTTGEIPSWLKPLINTYTTQKLTVRSLKN